MKRMIMLKCFILTLLGGFVLEVVVHAQDQSGFISIDCGLAEDSNYTDDTTGIAYSTDAAFIDTGLSNSILSEFITNSLELQLWTVRSFPEGSRNCYNLSAAQGKGKKYLIRAAFMYGNYDNQDQVPKFELHLGADLWDTVEPENASTIIKKEIIHVPLSNYIYVCLVNTNFGTPFISALELRLLSYSMYPTQSELESLASFSRLDFGSSSTTKQVVRYPDDFYDRIWFPFNTPADWVSLSTSLAINTANIYEPPFTVMSTCCNAARSNQTREFNICLDNKLWFGPLDPVFLSTSTIFSTTWGSKAVFDYSFVKTQKSDLQPIINALEIYIVKRFLESQTDEDDAFFSISVSPSPVSVSAIVNIKSLYGVMRNWQGDPCAPKAYLWEGLDCSYNGHDPPRIIYLNLSSSGLTGVIPPFISNLTLIQSLDLSNNSLTGPLPEFLSQLRFLKVLNLKGNKFSGPIPVELIERAKNGSLSLRTCPIEGGTYVSKVIGTPGYLDPEYYETNRLNEKSDVFSFGIVLLELITGRPAIAKREEKGRHILQWVNFMLETRDIGNIIDPRLEGEFDTNSVWKAVKVAMACVSHTSIKRPTMTLVLMELKECLAAEKAGREAHESDLKDIIGMMDGEIGPW
ncbi:hypothetical protein F0562_026468 [Nyssa sinensis]|uniref:Protein kinase domain-containing protein n=1 Tax=Nyssa sinensis TaxID=561372 RepID=A0A5J5BBH4_9ASTE|nr:hypothetical protein F0562_026468 [Nyssa sinensis]